MRIYDMINLLMFYLVSQILVFFGIYIWSKLRLFDSSECEMKIYFGTQGGNG